MGQIFDKYRIILDQSFEYVIKWRSRNLELESSILTSTILRLHARSHLIANEILHLCEAGYADGALSRWRSLYELSCICLFITKYGDECAERYAYHSVIDMNNYFQEYEKYKTKLQKPHANLHQKNIKFTENIKQKYEKEFHSPYGWAKKYLGSDRASFKSIEENVGLDHYRFLYKQASFGIHTSYLNLTDNLGVHDSKEEMLIVGPSSSGVALPIRCAIESLIHITENFSNLSVLEIEDVLHIKIFEHYQREIEQILLDIQNKGNF